MMMKDLRGIPPSPALDRLSKNTIFGSLVAAQGCAAIFNDHESMKMEERQNRIFVFPTSESSIS